MNKKNKNLLLPSKSDVEPLLNAFNKRNLNEAIKIGKNLLEKYPNAFFICNVLGSCYANLGQTQDSLEYFRRAYNLEPKIPECCSNLGMALQQMQKFDEASTYFEEAIKLKNDIPEVHYNFAVCLAKSKKFDLAKQSYQKAIELKPEFTFAYYNLGLLLWETNDLENALITLQKAIKVTPNNPEILASLGAVYKSIGDFKAAEKRTREALKLKEDPKFKFNLATIMRDQGLLNDARQLYEETITLDQNFIEAYNNLGEVLRDLGESQIAEEYFEKAISKNSKFSMAHYNLGILYQDANSLKKAIKFFEKSEIYDWRQRICYCAYKNNQPELFKEMFNQLNLFKHDSPLIGSIAAHYSLNNKTKNSYKFCPEPFIYIKKTSITSLVEKESSFRNELINDLNKTEIAERKQGRLVNGIQSAGNLLKRDEQSFRTLAGLILVEIDNYLNGFENFDCEFINSFPKKPEFQSSWYVKMQKSGHLTSHIHETGWLSGVLYIQLPNKTKTPEEGTIEFGFDGDNYPEGSTLPTERISLELGDLILFPSSLFHRTLPFYSDEERICIAFDISPPN